MRTGLVIAALAAGCSGDGGKGGDGPPPPGDDDDLPTTETTDTGTPTTPTPTTPTTPTTPPEPYVSTCPDGHAALEQLDIYAARDAFAACNQDTQTQLGSGLVELLLWLDSAGVRDLLGYCGEPTDTLARTYGPTGLLASYDATFVGTSPLTVTAESPAGAVAVAAFAAPSVVSAVLNGGTLEITVADVFGGPRELFFSVDVDDVHGDGSDVPLGPGVVLDFSTPEIWQAFELDLACSDPGSPCAGWNQSDLRAGTITFVQAAATEGAALEVAFDVEVGAWCNGPCQTYHTVVGTLLDEVSAPTTPFDLPFTRLVNWPMEVEPVEVLCDTVACDDHSQWLSAAAELCDLPSFAAADAAVAQLAADAVPVAELLEAAGADDTVRFEFPHAALFFATGDVPFNATDAMLLAGGLRTAVAGMQIATQYDVFDPAASPDTLVGDYPGQYQDGSGGGDTGWDTGGGQEQCVDATLRGVPPATFEDELETWLMVQVAGADFAAAQANLTAGFADLRAGLDLVPAAVGWTDFAAPPNAVTQGWRDDVILDADAAIASLGGADGPIPSAPAHGFLLDAFFAAPPDQASILSDANASGFLTTDVDCEVEFELNERVTRWLEEGAGALAVEPDANNVPALVDGDLWEALTDNPDEWPYFLNLEPGVPFAAWR